MPMPDKMCQLIEPNDSTHDIWATVVDLGGRDTEIEFTAAGIWRTRFEFDWDLLDALIDDKWRILDHRGLAFLVESVLEPSAKRAAERKVFVIARRI